MNTAHVPVDPEIFHAYDVRGIYGENLTDDVAYRIGRAAAQYLQVPEIAVGRDMRLSSPQLAAALIRGITDQGVNAIDLGMTTTDGLYFAVGKFNFPAGVMITASHNPAQYNGMKFCRAQAFPISLESGLSDIRDLAVSGKFAEPASKGQVIKRDITDDYVKHALSFVDVSRIRPLKVVIDAGNGMAGLIMPKVFQHLPCELVPLYFELDGNFPHHPASPIEPENMVDVQKKVREVGADLGAAFDGDADRMFPVDEHGDLVDGSKVIAAVSNSLLQKFPGSTILYNLIVSKSVPELINKLGGKAIRTRVGHSYIKAEMRQNNAIFGGEHSGHFYFRDNWFADSGLIALLILLELVSVENKPLSEILKPLDHGFRSGEINSTIADAQGKMHALEEHFGKNAKSVDHLDGVTLDFGDWWFNVRPSNTEPLLRLNLEANSRELMEQKRDEVLAFIRQ
ncbi:MAG: phosphomannomutase/phosphoglucomutase [Chloroflexi bacterium 13_1_20CM_54_36]|nr:MAG: phosphomannomutase/phosphoglucomutase [Ktedonobacter sp. 13_2_20CM_53_11]OLB57118.1 MAG: phosphomannomutase/phosphoglucomutase [Ktedonobacter sp. 13_2_20CM_2_56_8]OLD84012.1 MAG: phosphomannomutase/phosphoglucomutase [Chloroflexi bacterium 13_1_20CM_54_36]OLE08086.1 MAG: phosphomannomutase/phosphoglucomutase [Ktedonobacter sp. 13_1_20CM_4_53_11]TMC19172.1 MAG: phosphomannomutase/phosphoglucomutase [Chloroflexota bacterium]